MTASRVGALVLLYDIRGFTAASRRMAPAEIGAFATGAHRSILDLFADRPPTFAKNLGDGHLLLWETGQTPDPDLVRFVMDGARRARTAFAAFASAHEAGGARLPRHVGIGVAVGEVSRADDYYGTPLNLAARLQNLARPEGLAVDRTVFEVAAARDEAMEGGFRRARVRLKGLGSTVVWVRRPFSWTRLLATAGRWAAPVLLVAAYVLASDGGLGLPGAEGIRTLLDRHGVIVLRPVPPEAEVRAAADRARRRLAESLLAVRRPDGMIRSDFAKPDEGPADVWASSQNACALLKTPALGPDEALAAARAVEGAFENGQLVEGFGWLAHPGLPYTEAEPGLWTVAALAVGLARPGLLAGEARARWETLLARAQALCRPYRPSEDGGWNIFPRQDDPARHNPYSTTLALLALLETRSAGQGWEGSTERRDTLLASTARWLVERFEVQGGLAGWRRTMDPSDRISEGLSLQVHAELLRAEEEAGVALPPRVLEHLPRTLAALADRGGEAAYDAGEFGVAFTTHEGRRDTRTEAINFLWHPWAIEAAVRWLRRAERHGAAPEDVVRVRRTLGHLVGPAIEAALDETVGGFTFVAAELLYALAAVPPP